MSGVAGGDREKARADDEALLRAALAVSDGSSPDDAGLPSDESERLRGPLDALHAINRLRDALARRPEQEPQLLAGASLGHYEIGPLIAVGGMGEVYRARHLRLTREVAVKIIGRRSRFDPQAVARFEREAHLAAQVSHPNLVTLHEVIDLDGRLCLIFELLSGETLQARLTRGPLPPVETARVGEKVARGLTALHAAGLTHRDIKPGNIFLCEDGETKLLDMGIARPVERGADETKTGHALLGTPSYMPPERIRGGVYTPAGDVFCLGVVLYEAMVGHHPFRQDDLDATLSAIVDGEPRPASLSAPFVQLLDSCLQKDPMARPSAGEVAEGLGDLRAGRTLRMGGGPGLAGRVYWAAGLIGLVAVGAVGLWPSKVERPEKGAPTATRTPAARTAQGTLGPEAYRKFLEAQALADDASPASLKRASELYGDVLKAAPNFALGWARYANLLQAISAFVDGVDPTQTQAEGLRAARRALSLDPNLAEAHQALADLLGQKDDWEGAETSIGHALQLNPHAAEAHHSYSTDILIPTGRLQEAEEHSLRAVELEPSSSTYAEALGRVYYFQRRFDLAHQQWVAVLARNPRELSSMWRKGQAEIMLGRFSDALGTFALADSFTPGIQKGQALIAIARARSGDVAGARAIRDRLLGLRRGGRYVSPTLLGVIDVGLRDVDSAFENLMQACQAHADWIRFAKVEPLLDPLREDPRFGDLLRCLRLAP